MDLVWRDLSQSAGNGSGQVQQRTFAPIKLSIDKANVTRLNQRSVYPVVLYLLCYSG